MKLDSYDLKLAQVTYLKNFSLFVEPKVETLGIQEHVSLGRTLVRFKILAQICTMGKLPKYSSKK